LGSAEQKRVQSSPIKPSNLIPAAEAIPRSSQGNYWSAAIRQTAVSLTTHRHGQRNRKTLSGSLYRAANLQEFETHPRPPSAPHKPDRPKTLLNYQSFKMNPHQKNKVDIAVSAAQAPHNTFVLHSTNG
jgi:hypothetical protein